MKNGKDKISLFDAISYEYQFVISPRDVEADMRNVKQQVHELIRFPGHVLKSIPHIALYHFYSTGDVDTILKKSLHTLSGIKSFQVKLDGSRAFASEQYDRSMYIKVENSEELLNLHRALQMTFYKQEQYFSPVLAFASGMKADRFLLIESEVLNLEFSEGFDCQQVTLLRRRLGEESPFERVRTINLEG